MQVLFLSLCPCFKNKLPYYKKAAFLNVAILLLQNYEYRMTHTGLNHVDLRKVYRLYIHRDKERNSALRYFG